VIPSFCLVGGESVSGGWGVNRTHHSSITMGRGVKLFAIEPEGFGVVSDCEVPFGNFSLGGEDLDPARIETTSGKIARVSKGRLGDGVVSWDSSESEGNNSTICSVNTGGNVLENPSWGTGITTDLNNDLSGGGGSQSDV